MLVRLWMKKNPLSFDEDLTNTGPLKDRYVMISPRAEANFAKPHTSFIASLCNYEGKYRTPNLKGEMC